MTPSRLTPRQVQILEHVAMGMTSKESGAVLHLADKTVKVYRTQILKALGAKNAPHAVVLAHIDGILDIGCCNHDKEEQAS